MSNPFDIPMSAELAEGYGHDFSVSAQAGDEERVVESALRPHSLGDFIGQPKVARQLDLVLEGAKRRGRPPDHVLLSGPPGLGKTSLALIIGSELGTSVKITSGPGRRPARVVAPTSVNGGISSGIAVAPGPLPMMTSTRKSSMAR
jgi:Holliday junction DNA helicase RuvB